MNGLWQTPRTWYGNDNEYFNITPDYQRIKGNIEFIKYLIEEINFINFDLVEMEVVTEDGFPTDLFFNRIVENIEILFSKTVGTNIPLIAMRKYNSNDNAPSFRDLNTIEQNISNLYLSNAGVYNVKQKTNYAGVGILSIF